jgi:hypothetical protein
MNNKKLTVNTDILFYAFRYALGRKTYAVYDVTGEIISQVNNIPDKDLLCMYKEIIEHLNDNNYSNCFNDLVDEWERVRDCIENEISNKRGIIIINNTKFSIYDNPEVTK